MPAPTGNRRISRRTYRALVVILPLLLCLVVEVSSFCVLRFRDGHWYTWSSASRERARSAMAATSASATFRSAYVVHPYLGYVVASDWTPNDILPFQPFTWTEEFTNRPCDGFPSRRPVVQKRSADSVLLGIFGGSEAE